MKKLITSALIIVALAGAPAQASFFTWGWKVIKGFSATTKTLAPASFYGDEAMYFFQSDRLTRAMRNADGELGNIYRRYRLMRKENHQSSQFSCERECYFFLEHISNKFSYDERKLAAMAGLIYLAFMEQDIESDDYSHKIFLAKYISIEDIPEISGYFPQSFIASLIRILSCPGNNIDSEPDNGRDKDEYPDQTFPRHSCD